MITVELQLFRDVWQGVGHSKAGSTKALGNFIVFTQEGLKGIFHDKAAGVEAVAVEDIEDLYALAGKVSNERGNLTEIPLDDTKWAFRPGNPTMSSEDGRFTWDVLVPAAEAVQERKRLAAKVEPF